VPLNFPFLLFLLTAIAIAIVFALVARSTSDPAKLDYARANRWRGLFSLSLAVVLAIFLALTLPQLPYPVEAASPAQVVNVVGKQYAFSLTEGPGPQSLETWDAEFSPVAEVVQGTLVEFRVQTLDVNHGFGIYTPEGEILAQTQAMPGYVNRLRVRFDRPGTYPIMCLEFCGMSHHAMRGVIEVKETGR
jgi:cytochrome c oxidase subunit 2